MAMDIYVIWKFAENIDGAKQFLVDYIGNFRQGFLASEFYQLFPCFPQTVPDLKTLLARDDKANPPDKYKVLGRRPRLGHQCRVPWLCQRCHRRDFQYLGDLHHVCPGCQRQADARGGPQPGGRTGAAYLPKVARTR